jgi:hypothetical protein
MDWEEQKERRLTEQALGSVHFDAIISEDYETNNVQVQAETYPKLLRTPLNRSALRCGRDLLLIASSKNFIRSSQ